MTKEKNDEQDRKLDDSSENKKDEHVENKKDEDDDDIATVYALESNAESGNGKKDNHRRRANERLREKLAFEEGRQRQGRTENNMPRASHFLFRLLLAKVKFLVTGGRGSKRICRKWR